MAKKRKNRQSFETAAVPAGVSTAAPEIGGRPVSGDTALVGSAYEAAERHGRLQPWTPLIAPANAEIIPDKPVMDARSRDMARNDGGIAGAITLTKDHIAGQQYLLNAKPASRILFGKEDAVWETEFADEVEEKFPLAVESAFCWADASQTKTLTGMVQLAIASYLLSGEVLASAEWMPNDGRPFRSAMLMLDPDRLCNPNFSPMLPGIDGGVERDRRGAPVAYHIVDRHPADYSNMRSRLMWRRVMARKPNWGRPNILHIFEAQRPDQARGISPLVSALADMKMLREFSKVELQRAIVAATYAATLESDLPTGDVYAMMGGGDGSNPALEMMAQLGDARAARRSAAWCS